MFAFQFLTYTLRYGKRGQDGNDRNKCWLHYQNYLIVYFRFLNIGLGLPYMFGKY